MNKKKWKSCNKRLTPYEIDHNQFCPVCKELWFLFIYSADENKNSKSIYKEWTCITENERKKLLELHKFTINKIREECKNNTKSSITAYNLFISEKYSNNNNNNNNIDKEELWNQLNKKGKNYWILKANAKKNDMLNIQSCIPIQYRLTNKIFVRNYRGNRFFKFKNEFIRNYPSQNNNNNNKLSMGELTKLASNEYNNMSEEQKNLYL